MDIFEYLLRYSIRWYYLHLHVTGIWIRWFYRRQCNMQLLPVCVCGVSKFILIIPPCSIYLREFFVCLFLFQAYSIIKVVDDFFFLVCKTHPSLPFICIFCVVWEFLLSANQENLVFHADNTNGVEGVIIHQLYQMLHTGTAMCSVMSGSAYEQHCQNLWWNM